MERRTIPLSQARPARYTMIWRWHFYAGLFCMPFVLWLSLTGSLYLWRPQIEAWLDRPYDHCAVSGVAPSPDAEVAAALKAVPGSTLHRYILPESPSDGVRVLVTKAGEDWRVIVDPGSLTVMKTEREESRPMRLLFHLHGELLAGTVGSYIVEAAACWTIVMLATGLYLWWPRGQRLAGVAYPRLRAGRRILWRDLHAVTGIWVSLFALVLILTGLPWAKGWGTYLGEVRALTGTARGAVDWTIGGKSPQQGPPVGDHHAHSGMVMPAAPPPPGELARVIAAVKPLGIAAPVLITPPRRANAPWQISSDAADRPLRSEVEIDGRTGAVVGRIAFSQRYWIDRLIGYGVAVHEGALFGLANQLVGSLVALSLMALAGSGAVLWWRRRPAGSLGAPPAPREQRLGVTLIAAIVVLALYMPIFGATLLVVLLVEFSLLRHARRCRRWLGLPLLDG